MIKTTIQELTNAGIISEDYSDEGLGFTSYVIADSFVLLNEEGNQVVCIQPNFSSLAFLDEKVNNFILLIGEDTESPINISIPNEFTLNETQFKVRIFSEMPEGFLKGLNVGVG